MIKGVNKRIIEINGPDSIYFEKAIFYLKPNVRELPSTVTEKEVKRYISRLGVEELSHPKSHLLRNITMILLSLAAAVGITVVFLL